MLFLRRVYRCACLQAYIEKCFLNDKITILDINYHLNDNFNGRVFSMTVHENNNDYVFTCEDHLKIVLIGGVDKKKTCDAVIENDDVSVCVEYSNIRQVYCNDCLNYYLKLLYHYFYFVRMFVLVIS